MGTESNPPKLMAGQPVRVLIGDLANGPEIGIQGKSGVIVHYIGNHSESPLDPGCSVPNYRVDFGDTKQHTVDERWLEPI
jgi:hypothetical protein